MATEKQKQAARRNLEQARAAKKSGRTRPRKQPSSRLSDRDRAVAWATWSRIKRGEKYDVEIEARSWREVT